MPSCEMQTAESGRRLAIQRADFEEAWQRLVWAWPGWLAWPALWLLVLIATPIGLWAHGEGLFPLLATLGVVAHAFATLMAVAGSWPMGRLAASGGVIIAGAWVVEVLGTVTGLPFGDYHYTAVLQPQLGDVPVIIPLAWFMMLLPAGAMADALMGGAGAVGRYGGVRQLVYAGLAGLAFTAWDLYLDPQMVARGLWVWERPGDYFGIPWTNFAGWWLAATVLALLINRVQPPIVGPTVRVRLMVIYTLTWAFQALGLGLFWGQPGPALVGFAGMGVFVVAGWLKELHLWR